MRKPVNVGTVRMYWLSWYPKVGMWQPFWVAVASRVRARNVRAKDREAVVKICNEVYTLMKHMRKDK
tara:strand:+ start:2490 stop:2690 length:201 start_codon:yes stop_codon:yes gene_type:complete